MKKIINSLAELEIFVNDFLKNITKKNTAIIVQLSGDLGAGKTAFTKAAARYFSIDEEITSPTFVIQKEYTIKNHSFLKHMIHIDAYRLENKSELEYLGWKENIDNSENIIFIEWPQQVEGISMPNVISVSISILKEKTREIIIS